VATNRKNINVFIIEFINKSIFLGNPPGPKSDKIMLWHFWFTDPGAGSPRNISFSNLHKALCSFLEYRQNKSPFPGKPRESHDCWRIVYNALRPGRHENLPDGAAVA
jgi:hypothetical protein